MTIGSSIERLEGLARACGAVAPMPGGLWTADHALQHCGKRLEAILVDLRTEAAAEAQARQELTDLVEALRHRVLGPVLAATEGITASTATDVSNSGSGLVG